MRLNNANPTREEWHPQTRRDRDLVLAELRAILASSHFCNSKRYPALLKYIVESTLAGNSEKLKEKTLLVEVFGRSASDDTNTDTVVRYTAGEVRKRLLLYYSNHPTTTGVRISLPPGSYIPEFLHEPGESEAPGEETETAAVAGTEALPSGKDAAQAIGPGAPSLQNVEDTPPSRLSKPLWRRGWIWFTAAAVVGLAVVVGLWLGGRFSGPQRVLDDFWRPVLRNQRTVLICTGGNVFSEKNFSGVATAGKDVSYPFVSMQIASSIAQISRVLDHSGVTSELVSSNATPLTDLREHSLALLGGYNNTWTLRLLDPLRFRFAPDHGEYIMDRLQPKTTWERDHTLPYSSADDYAVVARFRDSTIDGWVVALAGLGRNGTEAAAQFVTSPHYLQLLRDQIGKDFGNQNIEFVLKVKVIDGKTGAPSILAVHTW